MRISRTRRALALVLVAAFAFLGGGISSVLATCGPFTDVPDGSIFCNFILQIYYLGITTGTSPTTYDPSATVRRDQMAAFVARTYDRAASRTSRRAALDQWWTTQGAANLGLTAVGLLPRSVKSDGADLWVASDGSDSVLRVRASDGKLLETWTGATAAWDVLVAMGKVFVTGATNPSSLYRIDPSQPAGAVTTVASNLGGSPVGIGFDGSRIWTANNPGSVSIVTPGPNLPFSVTTVSTGFIIPIGILYDGANIWVTDTSAGTLLKLDSNGVILQTVTVGTNPGFPIFDGTNIWVPNNASNSVSVVRASSGAVLATLTGNGLTSPLAAAFDGQRILVTNFSGNSVSLWKAADLSPIGSFATGANTVPYGACSDGINFWIALLGTNQLARF